MTALLSLTVTIPPNQLVFLRNSFFNSLIYIFLNMTNKSIDTLQLQRLGLFLDELRINKNEAIENKNLHWLPNIITQHTRQNKKKFLPNAVWTTALIKHNFFPSFQPFLKIIYKYKCMQYSVRQTKPPPPTSSPAHISQGRERLVEQGR